jgi:two-component system sensor histidine kinase UhpB
MGSRPHIRPMGAQNLRKPMKKRESLSGQVVAANLLLVVATLFAASAASSLDLNIKDQRLQFALLAMTVILALLLNILMLQRRFNPLEQLIRDIEAIDPADPVAFEAPEQPVEEIERLAHAFRKLLERIEAERRRAGRLQLRAQEEERKRVARDLHDEVNQALTAILLRLEALTQIAPPRLRDELSETKRLANQAMGELLQLARQLRPTALDDHGLVPAIEDQLRRFKAQHGVETRLDTEGELDDLGNDQQLVLYRVTQEALNNVARHSRAQTVSVSITRHDGTVALAVADDGAGFNLGSEDRGLGLEGMAERARLVNGHFEIDARPGRGTTLRLQVPA